MEPAAPRPPLSEREINDLLSLASEAGPAGAPAARKKPTIKLYDFKRPDKFSREEVRVVQIMHESFARLTCASLSAALRCLVHVHVRSVDQLTYEEFLRSIPNPTTLARIAMEPLKGEAVLEIDPPLTFSIVDRLLGGSGRGEAPAREHTSIETSMMEETIGAFLPNLGAAWSTFVELAPRLEGIETNPQFAQIVPPTEMALLVTLATRIGETEGMMNLCVPYVTIQDVVPQFSQQRYYSRVRRSKPTPPAPVAGIPVDVEVLYEGERVSLEGLMHLRQGSLVRIPGYRKGRAYLRAGGAELFGLEVVRKRGVPRPTYTLADAEAGTDLTLLGRRRTAAEAGQRPDALEVATRALSAEIGAAMKSIEGRMSELARRQEELQDQLIFQSPDKEIAASEETGQKRTARPFGFLSLSVCEPLAVLLAQEHPQLAALVLSYLEPAVAACVLARMPEQAQADVSGRIAGMGRTLPSTLRTVEKAIEERMRAAQSPDYILAGGIDAVAEILGVVDRATERNVVGALSKTDPELAEEIKKRMIVFEDVVLLSDDDFRKVLGQVREHDLLMALKGTNDEVCSKVWRCVGREKAETLKAAYEKLGRVKLRDVEAAQQAIVGTVRSLDEEGAIIMSPAGTSSVIG